MVQLQRACKSLWTGRVCLSAANPLDPIEQALEHRRQIARLRIFALQKRHHLLQAEYRPQCISRHGRVGALPILHSGKRMLKYVLEPVRHAANAWQANEISVGEIVKKLAIAGSNFR